MVSSKKAFSYFNNRFGLSKSTNGWWLFDCPVCIKKKSKKMAVNFTAEVVKCFLCGYGESIVDFVMMYEDLKYWDARDFIENLDESDLDVHLIASNTIVEISGVELPKGYMPIMSGHDIIAQRARNYAVGRNFNLETLDRLGFGYCNEKAEEKNDDYFGRLIIPFKRHGLLRYFIGRTFIDDFLRYKNPPTEKFGVGKADVIFNEDALEMYDTVFITEGWADAMTFGKYGTSTQGWSMSQYQKSTYKRSDCKTLVFIPDAGVDGQGVRFYDHAIKTAAEFLELKEEVFVMDMDEFAEFGKDANEIGHKKIMERLEEMEPLTFEKIIQIQSK